MRSKGLKKPKDVDVLDEVTDPEARQEILDLRRFEEVVEFSENVFTAYYNEHGHFPSGGMVLPMDIAVDAAVLDDWWEHTKKLTGEKKDD